MSRTIKKNNLQTLRKAKGWLQTDVAKYLHLAPLTIHRHEAHVNEIKSSVLLEYCRLYGVDVDEIYRDLKEE